MRITKTTAPTSRVTVPSVRDAPDLRREIVSLVAIQDAALAGRALENPLETYVACELKYRALSAIEAVHAQVVRRIVGLTMLLQRMHERVRSKILQCVALSLALMVTQASFLLLQRQILLTCRLNGLLKLQNRLLGLYKLPQQIYAGRLDSLLRVQLTQTLGNLYSRL